MLQQLMHIEMRGAKLFRNQLPEVRQHPLAQEVAIDPLIGIGGVLHPGPPCQLRLLPPGWLHSPLWPGVVVAAGTALVFAPDGAFAFAFSRDASAVA